MFKRFHARQPLARALGFGLLGLCTLGSSSPTEIHLAPGREVVGPFDYSVRESIQKTPASAWPLRMEWTSQVPGEVFFAFRQSERSTPQVLGDRVYLGSSRARGVLVYDVRDGALERRIRTRGTVEVPIRLEPASGDLLFGDTGGFFYRIRPDGTKVWEFESSGPVIAAAAVGDGKVFFPAIDGTLVALDAETGRQLWTYRREMLVEEDLAIFGASVPVIAGDLLISGHRDGSVVALNVDDGRMVWERKIVTDGRWKDVDGDPVLLDDDRIVIAAYNGPTVCLRVSTGEELWQVRAGGTAQPLHVEGVLYFPDTSGAILALAADNGERLWRWQLPRAGLPNQPVFWRGTLVVTSTTGDLYMLEPRTGNLRWRLQPSREITGFSTGVGVSDGALYAISDGGVVYALTAPDYVTPPIPARRSRWSWPGKGKGVEAPRSDLP